MERDLIREINELRRDPRRYADKIARNKSYFQGNVWKHPDLKAGIKTEEGAAAYDEAIDFLRNRAQPAGELSESNGLDRAAEDFLKEFQRDPEANVEIESIVNKYGNFTGNFRRLVQFGSGTPEMVVINLVVSDGDRSRGHRDALLLSDLTRVGVAHGEHSTFRFCSVVVACTKFDN